MIPARLITKTTEAPKVAKNQVTKAFSFVSFVFFVSLVCPREAGAQIFESIGIRAQGMGGAFVAVADDASATWWNPAGLAGGAFANAIVESGTEQDPRTVAAGAAAPASRSTTRGIAFAYPALGLSYYRLRVSEIRPFGPTADVSLGRQDQGPVEVRLSSLAVQQFGASVGQSLGDHLVVASTLKLVRGATATQAVLAADASLDRASELDGPSRTVVDLDFGAMAAFGHLRFGVVLKNATEPAFGDGADRVELRRQARVGAATIAVLPSGAGVTLALDADLTRTPTATGDARHIGAGVEAWGPQRRIGLRGGVSANTVGGARTVATGGLSLALRRGTYADAQATVGNDRARRGYGFALRLTF